MLDDSQGVRAAAHELTGAPGDFDALLDRIGDAGCVLLGESTTAPRGSTPPAPTSRNA